jgi:hypothetical protein
MINLTKIKALTPCYDRLYNYIKFYGDREFTPKQFMGLKKITHADKLWVAFRVLPYDKAVEAAIDIGKSILSVFEKQFPEDNRPRECIEAIRLYFKGKITLEQLNKKKAAARNAAKTARAAKAADANGAAAWIVAWAAGVGNAAVSSTPHRHGNIQPKETECRTIILKYWK